MFGCANRIAWVTKCAKSALRECFLVLLALTAPRLSAAQSPARWQVFAGYAPLNDVTDRVSYPAGWVVSVAGHLKAWLSVAGDVDGQYDTIPSIGSDFHLASHTVTVGPRASARLGRFVEFGQVLAGVIQSTNTVFGSTETTRHAVVQPGVGLDYPLSRKWAVRGELDARFINTGQEIRVVAGLVYVFR
jgi:hypothetical protein